MAGSSGLEAKESSAPAQSRALIPHPMSTSDNQEQRLSLSPEPPFRPGDPLDLSAAAGSVLRRYRMAVNDVRLLQFEDNAVYRVEAEEGCFILRLSVRDGRSPAEQRAELRWLKALHDDGAVLAPVPLRTGEGQHVV